MHALGLFLRLVFGGGRGRRRERGRGKEEVVSAWVRWGVGGLVVVNVVLSLLAAWERRGGEA